MGMKIKYNPRKLMELAVEVMRRTVSEPRKDGKASPLVGAVLRKSDGTVEKFSVRPAYRRQARIEANKKKWK